MWSHGKFYWNELMTRNAEAAKTFYGTTLGWTFDAMPHPLGTYSVAKLDGEPVAGMLPMSGPDFAAVPEQWLSYIAVDDVDARLRSAIAAGGKAIRGPFDVPKVGRIAIVQDPAGAVSGWITPAE